MKLNALSKPFSNMPKIETKRLVLRAIKRSDIDDIYEYSSNPKTSQFLLWGAHKTKAVTKGFIDIVLAKYKSGEYNDWAIVYKPTGKMIGTCGFTRIDKDNDLVEVGYVINPDYWGMGIATEALERVVEFAFEEMLANRIECKFMFGNEASLAVMKKIGMKFEGYQRDALFVKGKFHTIGTASILKREYNLKDKY